MMPWVGRLRTWARERPGVVAMVAYVLVIVAFTWPVARDIAGGTVGRAGDQAIAVWDDWWLSKALTTGQSPLKTTYLFYPQGVSLVFHSISWLTAFVALPFRFLFGAVVSYNITFLLETLLCAGSMFALVRYLTGNVGAAWLAGFAFTFEPYRVSRSLEHPNLANTGFIPLVLLCFFRAIRGEGRRFAWLTAASLACVLLTGAHLFVMTSLALALLFGLEVARHRGKPGPVFWRAALEGALACLVVIGPLLLPYLLSERSLDEVSNHINREGATDLASLFVRGPSQLFGAGSNYRFLGEAGSVSYLGWVPLALALLAWANRETRRVVWPFWVVFLSFLLVSFGPNLVVNNRAFGFPLPYARLAHFELIRVLRQPERFNLVARVFFAVAVGWGVVALERLLSRRPVLVLACYPLMLLDLYGGEYPLRRVEDSAFYRELRNGPGKGAIVPLPAGRQEVKRALLAQTLHERPIVGGMIARTPRSASYYERTNTLLAALTAKRLRPLDCGSVRLRRDLDRLRRDGVEFFVIRRDYGSDTSPFASYFVTKPYFTDRRIDVYRIADMLAVPLPCDPRPDSTRHRD